MYLRVVNQKLCNAGNDPSTCSKDTIFVWLLYLLRKCLWLQHAVQKFSQLAVSNFQYCGCGAFCSGSTVPFSNFRCWLLSLKFFVLKACNHIGSRSDLISVLRNRFYLSSAPNVCVCTMLEVCISFTV